MRYFYDGSADEDDADAEVADEEVAPARGARDASPDGGPRLADGEFDADDDALLDDGSLEADFPRGDGTADTEAVAYCPYCGELNEIAVDPGGGAAQSYVEDCHVCCRPWRVDVRFDAEGHASASLEPADDV